MAKIEEVTALLIDEIATFEKAIKEFKKQTEGIEKHKIEIDVSQVKNVFKEFEHKINTSYKLENNQLKVIQNKLNKSAIFPNWMAVLFSVFFIVLILSFGFNFYQYQQKKEVEIIAYKKGEKNIKNKMIIFFDKNPKSLKAYEKWSKKK